VCAAEERSCDSVSVERDLGGCGKNYGNALVGIGMFLD